MDILMSTLSVKNVVLQCALIKTINPASLAAHQYTLDYSARWVIIYAKVGDANFYLLAIYVSLHFSIFFALRNSYVHSMVLELKVKL